MKFYVDTSVWGGHEDEERIPKEVVYGNED